MIKADSLAKVMVKLKIAEDETKAKALIAAAEEHDIAIPETVSVFNTDEIAARDKVKYDEGKKSGQGMLVDSLFETHNIKPTGKKDVETFITEYQKKVLADANITVDEKVKEKEKTIEGLRTNIKALEQQHAVYEKQVKDSQLDTEILMWTADKKPDNLTNKEWVALIKMNNELVEEGGQLVVKRDGKLVQDPKLLTNVPAKDAIVSFIDERKLGKVIPAPGAGAGGGRGAGDSKTGGVLGITKKSQFLDHLKSQGIDEKGSQAKTLLNEITTANPDFDFNG